MKVCICTSLFCNIANKPFLHHLCYCYWVIEENKNLTRKKNETDGMTRTRVKKEMQIGRLSKHRRILHRHRAKSAETKRNTDQTRRSHIHNICFCLVRWPQRHSKTHLLPWQLIGASWHLIRSHLCGFVYNLPPSESSARVRKGASWERAQRVEKRENQSWEFFFFFSEWWV